MSCPCSRFIGTYIFFLALGTNYILFFSSIAVYKALYKSFGGFAADVVAAIDQVCGSQCDPFYKDSLIPQTRCTFEKVENLLFSG